MNFIRSPLKSFINSGYQLLLLGFGSTHGFLPARSITIKKFSKDSSDGITSLISWIMLSEDSDKHVTTWKLSLSPQARIKAPLQSRCPKFHKQCVISALQQSYSLVSPYWERICFLDPNTRTICFFSKHSLHYWNDLNSGAILLEQSWHYFVLQRSSWTIAYLLLPSSF